MLRGVRGGRYRIEANHDIPPNNTQAIMEALQSGPVACAHSLTIMFMEAFSRCVRARRCGIHAQGIVSYTKGIITDPDGGTPRTATLLVLCLSPLRRPRGRSDIRRPLRRDRRLGR